MNHTKNQSLLESKRSEELGIMQFIDVRDIFQKPRGSLPTNDLSKEEEEYTFKLHKENETRKNHYFTYLVDKTHEGRR